MITEGKASLESLAMYLTGFSGVEVVETAEAEPDDWWIDLTLDTTEPDVWQVVKTLGTALNAWETDGDEVTLFFPCPATDEDEEDEDALIWRVRGLGVTPDQALEQLIGISRALAPLPDAGM